MVQPNSLNVGLRTLYLELTVNLRLDAPGGPRWPPDGDPTVGARRVAGEESPDPFVAEAVPLLDTIPGVGEHVAQMIIAERGVDMGRLPTAGHLASRAGLCPGNDESAGKRKSGKTTKGSPDLRAAVVQAAWAASHSWGTSLRGNIIGS
jgi:hypothetical protein